MVVWCGEELEDNDMDGTHKGGGGEENVLRATRLLVGTAYEVVLFGKCVWI